jgi:diguanylate cyclase (GGDEF)-like protein
MIRPPKPDNEAERLSALRGYEILDTPQESAFDDLVLIASAVCGMPMGSVSLIDADRQWFKARLGIDDSETSRDVAFCAHAILEPENVMVVPDATDDPRFRDNPFVVGDPGIRFYAGAPLIGAEGLPLGTLCVMDRQPRTLQPHQIEALNALSRQVSQLLALRRVSKALNLQLQDRGWYEDQLHRYQEALEAHNADLVEQTRTDPLTGLANRRAFSAALGNALQTGTTCCVAIIDIDHFKVVNDVHGHLVGDRVLAEVAGQLRAASGGHGTIARYGGEEFVWLLPGTPIVEAELQCNYLCEAVRHASDALPVTISVGLAASTPDESLAALMERADRALYAAKRNGRDRVEVAD